jgi:hypothetical protein
VAASSCPDIPLSQPPSSIRPEPWVPRCLNMAQQLCSVPDKCSRHRQSHQQPLIALSKTCAQPVQQFSRCIGASLGDMWLIIPPAAAPPLPLPHTPHHTTTLHRLACRR